MRVLVVIAEMGSGGAESVVAQLAAAAAGRGDEVCVASAPGGWRLAELDAAVTVLPLPLREPGVTGLLGSARLLRRHLRGRGADVVHAHNVRAALAARLGLARASPGRGRAPLVVTVHGLAASRYRLAAWVLRIIADRVVAVSDDVDARLRGAGYPASRLRVIENATAPLPATPRQRARAELELPEDAPVVLCLARLAPQKRHDLLLGAWRDLAGDLDTGLAAGAVLLIAGDGPERDGLTAYAARLGVAPTVRFLGDRRDVGRLLSASDVLVLASDWEGLPVTVLEAMAHGVAVVASRVGGLASLDPEAVRLVEPGSSTALAAALKELLADPGLRRRTADRGRALVSERFSPSVMDGGYHTLLDEVATAQGP